MNENDQIWMRLARASRQAKSAEELAALPPGFATRVVARWLSSEDETFVWEIFSVRALACACVLMLVAFAITYDFTPDSWADDLVMNNALDTTTTTL